MRCTPLSGDGMNKTHISIFALMLLIGLSGCTSRGITVTSVPPGAEVSINRRVVGVTPIRVGFTHYGTYRIELRKEKYQTLVKEESVNPPIYGYDPVALVADNLIPARLNDEVYLHYVMKSQDSKNDKDALTERDSLMERAELARDGMITHPSSGELVQVTLNRESKRTKTLANSNEGNEPLVSDASTSSTLDKPIELSSTIKDITAKQPEGPRLAKELNVEAPAPDKRAAFIKPEEAKKPAAPKAVRTPKEEGLIFDSPAITDPKDEKKSGAKKEEKVVEPLEKKTK
jgi:hypothetical protein